MLLHFIAAVFNFEVSSKAIYIKAFIKKNWGGDLFCFKHLKMYYNEIHHFVAFLSDVSPKMTSQN